MKKLNIALVGYGKMGKAVEAEAVQRGHAIVARIDPGPGCDSWDALKTSQVDAVIEFTSPDQALANFKRIMEYGLPLVTGTTGWHEGLEEVQDWVTSSDGAFLYSSNFSPGVNILFRLNQVLADLMNRQGGYDVFLEEAHHRHKKDAPSGTALTLATDLIQNLDNKHQWVFEGLAGRAPLPEEISIAVTRAGEIIGKHSVVFRSEIDEIRISHEAFNRRGFALGAVLAAEWIQDKRGFFNFTQIFT